MNNETYCDFCGKNNDEVEVLIKAERVNICNECNALAKVSIDEKMKENKKSSDQNDVDSENKEKQNKLPNPRQMFEHLNNYIVGQEDAKKTMGVAVYNHYKRVMDNNAYQILSGDNDENINVKISKSNVLMLGPTGSGKTLIAETLADYVGVPFAIVDATTLTQAGYVGDDVESILGRIITVAGGNIELAQKGIIYIDEIDKIATKGSGPSVTRDVSGEGVQQALLKIIEGTTANITLSSGRKNPQESTVPVSTKDILFICSGSFPHLKNIIGNKDKKSSIGFGSLVDNNHEEIKEDVIANVTTEDLVQFGLIPELIGRLPVITTLKELNKDDLMKIITEPKNSILKQYKKIFAIDGIELVYEDNAIEEIATLASERKIGARGLRAIIENILKEAMYQYSGDENISKIIITKESVRNSKVKVEYRKKIKKAV